MDISSQVTKKAATIQFVIDVDVREAKDLRYYLNRHTDNKRPRTKVLRQNLLDGVEDALDEAGELV